MKDEPERPDIEQLGGDFETFGHLRRRHEHVLHDVLRIQRIEHRFGLQQTSNMKENNIANGLYIYL